MLYFKDPVEQMTAYVPGEQPADVEEICKLNTNENPYPPSPKVAEVLRTFSADRLRVYPDPCGRAFTDALADVLEVPRDWVIPGNGSDNLIVMAARACPGPIVAPVPTFPFYETQARIEVGRLTTVPLEEDFRLPIDALLAARGALTFLANPNSPTGLLADIDELDRLAVGLDGLLVIDEAYADFAPDNAVRLVREHPNVVVFRTLSKGYSLAGLRLGAAIAQPAVLDGLWKTKEIYNVGALTLALGAAAVADQAHKLTNVERILASRETLRSALETRGWTVWPSEANFLLARPPAGHDARAVGEALKTQGVLVRYFNQPRLADKLRITVGTDAQHERLLRALDQQKKETP
jgi:histidinol-phosphate aminotransferase